MLDQAREPDRDDEEQPDREHQRDDHRPGPGAARDLLFLLGELGVGGDTERLQSDTERLGERHDAADHRPPVHATSLGERLQRRGS